MNVTKFLRYLYAAADTQDGPDGCWLWPGRRYDPNIKGCRYTYGYGSVVFYGHSTTASRVVLGLMTGPLAPHERACHTCDNAPCVRPDHLFRGTHTDNMRDMVRKGRAKKAHCRKGHPRTPENRTVDDGCRVCMRERSRARYREKKLRGTQNHSGCPGKAS